MVTPLCVASNVTLTLGWHYPQLLLKAADSSSLGDFLSGSRDANTWGFKVEVVSDGMSGFEELHNHGAGHCDLKSENTLVFKADKDDNLLRRKIVGAMKIAAFYLPHTRIYTSLETFRFLMKSFPFLLRDE